MYTLWPNILVQKQQKGNFTTHALLGVLHVMENKEGKRENLCLCFHPV